MPNEPGNPPRENTPPCDRAGDSDDDSISDDDNDSFSDDSEPKNKAKKLPKQQASTPRSKRRAAMAGGAWSETPARARRRDGAGNQRREDDGEISPWESMAGLSLCQFWRYRLLLEVVLAARGEAGRAGGGGPEEEQGGVPEPRLAEVREAMTARREALGKGGGYGECSPVDQATHLCRFLERAPFAQEDVGAFL